MTFLIKKNPAVAQPYYFVIKAANGETLATSEMYATKQSAAHACRVVAAGAANASVVADWDAADDD